MFALRFKNTKKLMGFDMFPNRSVNGNEVKLTEFSDFLWVVKDREIAEKAATTSSSSYTSNFLYPVNNYVGQLEVVEFDIVLKKQKEESSKMNNNKIQMDWKKTIVFNNCNATNNIHSAKYLGKRWSLFGYEHIILVSSKNTVYSSDFVVFSDDYGNISEENSGKISNIKVKVYTVVTRLSDDDTKYVVANFFNYDEYQEYIKRIKLNSPSYIYLVTCENEITED